MSHKITLSRWLNIIQSQTGFLPKRLSSKSFCVSKAGPWLVGANHDNFRKTCFDSHSSNRVEVRWYRIFQNQNETFVIHSTPVRKLTISLYILLYSTKHMLGYILVSQTENRSAQQHRRHDLIDVQCGPMGGIHWLYSLTTAHVCDSSMYVFR